MNPTRSYYSTKVVIDSETLEVLERDIVPYTGPWELADEAPGGVNAETDIIDPPSEGGGDEPAPAEPVEGTPAEGDAEPAPAEGEPVEGEPEPEPQPAVGEDGQPIAPKPPTPQELAADATLKKAYRENFGQVKEVLKAHPELRPAFFKAAELNEIFTTPEDAKQAREWATQLYKFDNLYYSQKPEDKRQFLQALYENSLEEDGSSPHYDQVASLVVEDGLSNLASRIQGNDANISRAFSDIGLNNKQAMVAVQAVAAMLGIPLKGVRFSGGGGAAPAAGPNGTPQMSEREQWLANEVARLNSEVNASRQSTLAQTEQNFYSGIHATFTTNLAGDIAKRLEPATALKSQKPGFQNWVKSEVQQRTINAVRSDEFFANQMEAMSRSGNRGPEHQQRLVAALEQRARQFLPDVLREVLQEAGIQITQKTNTARAQAGTPHREPVTSGTPGRLSKPGGQQPSKPKSAGDYNRWADDLLGIK